MIWCALYLDIASNQGALWEDTLADDPTTEIEARQGGLTPTYMNPQLHHDIQVQLSRLIGKAEQLIENQTTNLAESWMHIRAKFDWGKFINRSQSRSWEHRCMGAGLRQNLGREWGPLAWKEITKSSPNKVFIDTAEYTAWQRQKEKSHGRSKGQKTKKQICDRVLTRHHSLTSLHQSPFSKL